jgi:hypothetical protein
LIPASPEWGNLRSLLSTKDACNAEIAYNFFSMQYSLRVSLSLSGASTVWLSSTAVLFVAA